MTAFLLSAALIILWFTHWGWFCVMLLRRQQRSTALAIPLSFLGPLGALIAYVGSTPRGQRIIDAPLLNPAEARPDDDLPL